MPPHLDAGALDTLWTPDETADYLKIKVSWLYQHVHTRDLPFPHVKVGRYLRFPASCVQAFVQEQIEKDGRA
ncbi:MAG: helix-turn-helix domain-containing protein [Acidobacteriota bacterium]|jgi:excisionase family DNA binding protein